LAIAQATYNLANANWYTEPELPIFIGGKVPYLTNHTWYFKWPEVLPSLKLSIPWHIRAKINNYHVMPYR